MTTVVYVLRCADGSHYVGSTRGESLDRRVEEHQSGHHRGYTRRRRPVTLVEAEAFERIVDAIAAARCITGCSRDKQGALIRSESGALRHLARRSTLQRKSAPTPLS